MGKKHTGEGQMARRGFDFGGFIRMNALALAITTGVCAYFAFRYAPFLQGIRHPVKQAVDAVIPWCIFTMLFIAFARVEPRRMRIRRWHCILLCFQVFVPLLCALSLRAHPSAYDRIIEGILACTIIPTAAAASVITGRLGGDESSMTVWLMLSNAAAAVSIPLIFPLVTGDVTGSFVEELMAISLRVFPMIVLPLVSAQIIRFCFRRLHRVIVEKLKDVSFYIWAGTLTCISATAVSNMMNSDDGALSLLAVALTGLFVTALQFGTGKLVGHMDGQRITGGQALGQKNMVFGIWVTSVYLSPAAAIAPGCYILWQNIMNSWQIRHRERNNITYRDRE